MGSNVHRSWRPACLPLILLACCAAGVARAQTPSTVDGAPRPAGPPATRNAAVAELLAGGFSSVTALRDVNGVWTGQGVRHASLVDFTIDRSGVLRSQPVR